MIVYKIDSYSDIPRRGLVIKETAKQFKVREWETQYFKVEAHWSDRESTWMKEGTYLDIATASAALIARAEEKLRWAKEDVIRREKELAVAMKWALSEEKGAKDAIDSGK